MKNVYQLIIDDVYKEFTTSKNGLSTSQVEDSRKKHGTNTLLQAKAKSIPRVFFEQFLDLLVLILIIAGVISMLTKNLESTIVIFVVIIINAILGTVQHFKAQKSLDSLKALSTPYAKVIRNGEKINIPSAEVVVGDVLTLEAGDLVVADGRITENFSLQVNESSLTGESQAIVKTDDAISGDNIALGDRTNMVFSSGLVTYGRANIVVTATGMGTELGKIADLMNQTQAKKTPLQVSLDNFSKMLSIIIMIVCLGVFLLSIYRQMEVLDALMFAVALAVAAIPEALSSIVTIALAIGTSKMAKQNAIIKNLRAVEGLGCVSIVCSDKTGTLTQNKMTVRKTFHLSEANEEYLLKCSILCNDSYVSDGKFMGDPTETALLEHYMKNFFDTDNFLSSHKRLGEIPFDSDRKMMSTVYSINSETKMITKGAMDVILGRCTRILDGNKSRTITAADIENINKTNHDFSNSGLRVLGFAHKTIKSADITLEDEKDFTFIGLIAMIDPPREESKQAVSDCITAGIKPIMITGDHKITATAIAKEIGIFKDGDIAFEGVEIDKMSDEELTKILDKVSVYARVSPEHKIRIVDLWQKQGQIVSMTGDGVNDAPALKKADIGIAMGITGTAVSKDAASMILTDDNFATIIKSITNGRNIYNNIKNSIRFLLSGNMSAILGVVYASLAGLSMPFAAVHLLFINLLTDSLPAIAISMENPKADLLKEKPRNAKESILTKDFLIDVAVNGTIIAIFTILAFYWGLQYDAHTASTIAFATLCLARLWHGFNCRSNSSSIFKIGLLTNKYSLLAFFVGVILLAATLLFPPLQNLFEVIPLAGIDFGVIAICSVAPTVIIQIMRIIKDLIKK